MFQNKKAQNYELIIAAIVAVVAVIGLVMFAQSSASGAANIVFLGEQNPTYRSQTVPVFRTAEYEQGEDVGEDMAVRCYLAKEGELQCCARECSTLGVKEARRGCTNVCRLRTAQKHSRYVLADN